MAGISTGSCLLTASKPISLARTPLFWLDGVTLNDSVNNVSPVSGSINIINTTPVNSSTGSYYTNEGVSGGVQLVYPAPPQLITSPDPETGFDFTTAMWVKNRSTGGIAITSPLRVLDFLGFDNSYYFRLEMIKPTETGDLQFRAHMTAPSASQTTNYIVTVTPSWILVGLRGSTKQFGFIEVFVRYGNTLYTERLNVNASGGFSIYNNFYIKLPNTGTTANKIDIDSFGLWKAQLSNADIESLYAGLNYSQLGNL